MQYIISKSKVKFVLRRVAWFHAAKNMACQLASVKTML